jgi:hypothetical protein
MDPSWEKDNNEMNMNVKVSKAIVKHPQFYQNFTTLGIWWDIDGG